MKASPNKRFVTVLFGSLGDGLMALAFFDDLLSAAPGTSVLILTRRNAGMIRTLASEYPQITVAEIPCGLAALPFFCRVLMRPGATLLMLGLASARLSAPLRMFLRAFALIPGNKTIGFYDPLFDVRLEYRIRERIYQNFRRMLPHALPGWRDTGRLPAVRLPHVEPAGFSYKPGGYVVFHLFGTSITHALPAGRWRALLAHATSAHPGLGLVLTGTPAEQVAITEVAVGLPVYSATGLSIPELVWIIDNAALYVGIDTGVTHIAGVLQQKSIVVRHCSDPSWIPDYNPHARVLLNSRNCNPEDPTHCLLVTEAGADYRRCTYDISDTILAESLDSALMSRERDIPGFSGVIDESVGA